MISPSPHLSLLSDPVETPEYYTMHNETLGPRFYGNVPNLNYLPACPPALVAERKRREDDMRTAPFPLTMPRYTDADIDLPRPYNAAFPHPLTAYVSPAVNMTGRVRQQWREKLQDMLDLDRSLVQGSILASSDTLPPALTVPMFDEGCAIPERLWSHIERDDGSFVNLVATPGGRPRPTTFSPIRTNFSNVLRREKPKAFKEKGCACDHGCSSHERANPTPSIPVPPRHLYRTHPAPSLMLDDESYASSVASSSPITPTFGSLRSARSVASWESFSLEAHDVGSLSGVDSSANKLASAATRSIWSN